MLLGVALLGIGGLARANAQSVEEYDSVPAAGGAEIPKNEVEIGFVTEELKREIYEGAKIVSGYGNVDQILNIFENHLATYYTLNGSSEIGDYSAQHEDEVQERIDAALEGMVVEKDVQERIDAALVGMVPEDEAEEAIPTSLPTLGSGECWAEGLSRSDDGGPIRVGESTSTYFFRPSTL